LFIEEIASKRSVASKVLSDELLSQMQKEGVPLHFTCENKNDSVQISLSNANAEYDLKFMIPLNILNGNITFVANSALYLSEYFFDDFSISGEAISTKEERKFGPISTCLYSFNENILNFSAQVMPLDLMQSDSVQVDLFLNNEWTVWQILPVAIFYGQARLRNYAWNYSGKIPYQ